MALRLLSFSGVSQQYGQTREGSDMSRNAASQANEGGGGGPFKKIRFPPTSKSALVFNS